MAIGTKYPIKTKNRNISFRTIEYEILKIIKNTQFQTQNYTFSLKRLYSIHYLYRLFDDTLGLVPWVDQQAEIF